MTVETPRLRHDTRGLEALRATLLAMIREGHAEDALGLVVELLAALRDQNDVLQVRLRTALRRLYGRRSEKLSPDQLALFARLLGDDTPAPSDTPAPASSSSSENARGDCSARGRPHGRGEMPAELPRRTTRVPVPEADRSCRTCGGAMAPFGVDTHWRGESDLGVLRHLGALVPGQRAAKRRGPRNDRRRDGPACTASGGSSIETGPAPARRPPVARGARPLAVAREPPAR